MASVPVEHALLQQQDEEYRRLAMKHHSCDMRLHELQAKLFLSDEEKLEELNLKKQKLHLKDRMEEIIRRHREFAS